MSAADGPALLVDGFTLVGPEDWVQVPVEPVADEDAPAVLRPLLAQRYAAGGRAAAELDDGALALAVLLRRLTAQAPQAVAVWLPDPPAPTVAAALVVDLLPPDGSGAVGWEELVHQVTAEQPAPGTTRQWRAVHVLDDVPWGQAVMAHEVAAVDSPTLEERITYLVRPHGTVDLVRLAFSTPYLTLSEDFREAAVAFLLHLDVDVVAAP